MEVYLTLKFGIKYADIRLIKQVIAYYYILFARSVKF